MALWNRFGTKVRISPRTLSYAVFAYAAFSFGSGLDLIGLIFGGRKFDWLLFASIIIWITFIAGGIGLFAGKVWGQRVVFFAASAAILQVLSAFVLSWSSDLPLETTLILLLGIIFPPGGILVGTLLLSDHSGPTPSKNPANSRALILSDVAYGCFLFFSSAVLFIIIFSSLLGSSDSISVFMFSVGIPLVFGALGALIGGVVVSILVRKPGLFTLSILGVGAIGIFGVTDLNIVLVTYSIFTLSFSLWWFVRGRKAV